MACWDILGKKCGVPVCTLLGGRFGENYPLYRAISQGTPEEMVASVRKYRAEGYTKFQLKAGSTVEEDVARIRQVAQELEGSGCLLMVDFNTGLLMHEAVRVVHAVADVDCYIEQPCASYEECLSVRRLCARPFILDENIDSVDVLLRIWKDQGADAINLKISKVGGITKARQVRDLCVSLGIAMNLEDTWGGDCVTAAIAHLAHSTPPRFRLASTDFNSYSPVSFMSGAPRRENGRLAAPTAPGLGVEGKMEVLGEPVAVYE
jgi:cis-L-3-hydroxyproline dehydratase